MAAEVERCHCLEQARPAPQCADARRAAHLVGRECEEVAVELLHVDRVVRRGLRRVDDHDRSLVVGPGCKSLDRVDRAERIRDEVVGDDLDVPQSCDLVERVEAELAVRVERDRGEGRAVALGDVLPRDEVRVVLELRDEHDVPRAEVVEAPRIGDEIDALRRPVSEDQFARIGRIHELRNLLAGAFVFRRCDLRERVDAAMDVRVRRFVERA